MTRRPGGARPDAVHSAPRAMILLCILLATPAARGAARPRPLATPLFQPVSDTRATPPDFKVALLGDQGVNAEARAVLALIKRENPSLVLLLGNLGYEGNSRRAPLRWLNQLNEILGEDLPVFSPVGNHDVRRWARYASVLVDRQEQTGGTRCSGSTGSTRHAAIRVCSSSSPAQEPCRISPTSIPHTEYLTTRLAGSEAIWKICVWAQEPASDAGGRQEQRGRLGCLRGVPGGWRDHRHGARAFVCAHQDPGEHAEPARQSRLAGAGRADGLARLDLRRGGWTGGESIREQERCRPFTYPYGCDGEWARIYTSDQGAKAGALFLTFHVDGDPRKARSYFKNVDGEIVDRFTVHAR